MNPLFNEAATTVQGTWVMGLMTAAFLLFFLGWVVWAYHPTRREAMEQAARMPFNDDGPGGTPAPHIRGDDR